MKNETKRNHHRQTGFSLVEMLIAIAILGTLLLSIITLFFLGRSTVYSGKQMTRAVAVASRITEDLQPMTRDDVYSNFGLYADGFSSVTIAGKTYANSVRRDTDSITSAKDVGGYLTKWKALVGIDTFANILRSPAAAPGGRVILVFTPTETAVAPSAEPADPETSTSPTSRILKIRAIVEWTEGSRARHVIVDTVKTVRR